MLILMRWMYEFSYELGSTCARKCSSSIWIPSLKSHSKYGSSDIFLTDGYTYLWTVGLFSYTICLPCFTYWSFIYLWFQYTKCWMTPWYQRSNKLYSHISHSDTYSRLWNCYVFLTCASHLKYASKMSMATCIWVKLYCGNWITPYV
jgi:hypothetical protein